MDNSVRMQIIESMHQLLSDLANLILWKVSIIFKNFKQLTLSKLRDHAELMRCFKWIQQQDDILVVQPFQDIDFLSQIIELFLSFAPFGNKLESNDLSTSFSASFVDLSKWSFTNGVQDMILIHLYAVFKLIKFTKLNYWNGLIY